MTDEAERRQAEHGAAGHAEPGPWTRGTAADGGELPALEFGFPGPLRDRLVAAVLNGRKTATTGLVAEYRAAGEELPRPGRRYGVVDSAGARVTVVEVTEVRVVELGEVDAAHARDEGEGHRSVAEWRRDHEAFWHGAEMREALGEPSFTVNDGTAVVLERFRLAGTDRDAASEV